MSEVGLHSQSFEFTPLDVAGVRISPDLAGSERGRETNERRGAAEIENWKFAPVIRGRCPLWIRDWFRIFWATDILAALKAERNSGTNTQEEWLFIYDYLRSHPQMAKNVLNSVFIWLCDNMGRNFYTWMSSEAFYMSQVASFSTFCSFFSLILSPDTFRTYLTNDFGNPDTGKFQRFVLIWTCGSWV